VLANFRWSLTLKDAGTGFPSQVDNLMSGTTASKSVQRVLMSVDVLESAVSTVLRKAARKRNRHSKAFLISGGIALDFESNSVVCSRS
jgi:hypothetical protein